MSQPKPVAFPVRENRRKHERSAVKLDGHLFVPAEESEQPCQIVDLSAGGARVICEDVPPCATYVILYFDGFGRFPAAGLVLSFISTAPPAPPPSPPVTATAPSACVST